MCVCERPSLTGDHDGLGVSSQTVLQQPCQHRVPVGDEDRLLLQVGVGAVGRHVGWTDRGAHTETQSVQTGPVS